MELNNIDNPFFIKYLNKKFDKENIKLTDKEKNVLITDFINVLNILIKTIGFSWKDKHNKNYISAKDFIIFQDEKNLTSLVSTYESSSC